LTTSSGGKTCHYFECRLVQVDGKHWKLKKGNCSHL
jgi:hypothetical protein